MPLSEEELRLLEQMERALVAEDPKLAHKLRGTGTHRVARGQLIGAAVVFAAGIAIMMGGAISNQIAIGIVGFVLMLASATWGLSALRKPRASSGPTEARRSSVGGFGVIDGGRSGSKGGRSNAQFMERLEERWRKRRDNDL